MATAGSVGSVGAAEGPDEERSRERSDSAARDSAARDSDLPDSSPPGGSRPDTSLPHSSPPDSTPPDTSGPDTTGPDTTGPDTSGPVTSGPDTSGPDSSQPDASAHDGSVVGSSRPDGSAPDGSPPDISPNGSSTNSNGNGSNGGGPEGGGDAGGSPWAAPEWMPRLAEPASGAAAAAPGVAITHPGAQATPSPYPQHPYQPGQYPPGTYPPASYPPASYPSASYPSAVHPAGSFPGGPPPLRQPPRGISAAGPARTHRWGLGAYLLVEAVFLLTSVLVGWVVMGGGPPAAGGLIAALAVPTVLAAGTAVVITRLRGNGPRTDLRLQWSWGDVGLGLAFGLGGLALTVPASLVYVSIVGQDASSAVGDVFGPIRTGPVLAALVLVTVVFVAPLCEEIVYRGLLWGGVERLANRWVAFGVTTLLFAMAHFEFTRTPLLLVVALPIAAARLYTGRLLPSIVAHQVNNLLPGIVLMLGLLGLMPAS
ncbi:MAG: protease family protein [Pseudonocardia sp.]